MVESVVQSPVEIVVDSTEKSKIRVLHVDDELSLLKVAKQCLEIRALIGESSQYSGAHALDLQKSKQNKAKAIQRQDEVPFSVELTLDNNSDFYDILLEAIDKSFLSLGESVKTSIYFYLENWMGIRKHEIPFRIDDFQNALEKLFGVGTRHLEILVIKNLHEKIKIKYRKGMPRWVIPDLKFQEYIRLVKKAYENTNERTEE